MLASRLTQDPTGETETGENRSEFTIEETAPRPLQSPRTLSQAMQQLEHRLCHHVSSGTIVSNGVSGLRLPKSLARLSANMGQFDISPEFNSKGVLVLG